MKFDVKTEAESESVCALLSVLWRFGFVDRCNTFSNGDVTFGLPYHWSIKRGIPGKPGHAICAYILNYNRKENKYG